MELIADDAASFADVNPKLTALYGMIYAYQAKEFRREKKHEGAKELYQIAASFGDHWEFYHELARLDYFNFKDYERALGNIDSLSWIAFLLSKKQEWDLIIKYCDEFIKLQPTHSVAYLERARAHLHNSEPKKTLSDLEKGCELGNEEACRRFNAWKGQL